MSDADIAELLAVAYASHCTQCEAAMENPVSCDFSLINTKIIFKNSGI